MLKKIDREIVIEDSFIQMEKSLKKIDEIIDCLKEVDEAIKGGLRSKLFSIAENIETIKKMRKEKE